MRGIVADTKTGKVELVDDGLPFPEFPTIEESEPRDLAAEVDELRKKVAEVDRLKQGLEIMYKAWGKGEQWSSLLEG